MTATFVAFAFLLVTVNLLLLVVLVRDMLRYAALGSETVTNRDD